MAQFGEASSGGLHGEQNKPDAIVIPLPEEPDTSWCSILTTAYGRGSYRAVIRTHSFLRLRYPVHGRLKRYENYTCRGRNGEPAEIDGLLVGIKLIPDFVDGPYIPHAVLVDTEQQAVPFWIADHPDQEFLVPLNEVDEQLVVYPDPS